jgi:hypothetical protein
LEFSLELARSCNRAAVFWAAVGLEAWPLTEIERGIEPERCGEEV